MLSLVRQCARSGSWRHIHTSRLCREQHLDVNHATFTKVALNKSSRDKVILVDFYADWCGPCKVISPVLRKLTGDPSLKTGSGRSVDLVTVDIEKHTELAQQYRIASLPTVIAFRDGLPVDHFIGALGVDAIKKFLQRL